MMMTIIVLLIMMDILLSFIGARLKTLIDLTYVIAKQASYTDATKVMGDG